MNHYIDLKISENPDISAPHVMGTLYMSLHLALGRSGITDVGVSFPGADARKPSIGSHLRVHGSQATLENLMASKWLHGLSSLLRVSGIQEVPADAKFRTVKRVQGIKNSNIQRLRRRLGEREGVTEDVARERIPESLMTKLNLPYIGARSASSGQVFNIHIEQGPVLSEAKTGTFTSYGLSDHATRPTVPWF